MRGAVRPWSGTVVLSVLACLLSSPIRAQSFDTITDARTGIRIAIPLDIVGRDSTPQEWGSSWGSRTSHLNIDTLNYGATRALPELFSTMKSRAGRNVTAQEYRDDAFYLKGNQDGGTTQIYIRMRAQNGEVRGVAIAYDSSASKRLEPVVDKIMASFEPFAAPATIAAAPLSPGVAATPVSPNVAAAPAPATAAPAGVAATPAPVTWVATAAPAGNLPVEIVPPMLHSGDTNSIVVSRGQDGFVASSGDDGIIKLWDMATGRLIRNVARIDPENKYWRVLQLSGDGQRLLGRVASDAVLWDTVTARQILLIKDVSEDDTVLTAGGTRVVTRRKDNSIRAFDARTGKELAIFKGAARVAFSLDGAHTVAVGADRTIYETDTTAGTRGKVLTTADAPIDSIYFTPNGKSLVIKMTSDDLALWSFEQARYILRLKGDKDSDYFFSSDGNSLAFQGPGESVEVFDNQTGAKRSSFKIPRPNLAIGGFLQGDSQLYFVDRDDSSVVLLNLRDGAVSDAHSTLPDAEALGSRYYVSEQDGILHLKDIENGEEVRAFGGEATVDASAFLPSGARVAVASNKQPRIFDPQTGVVIAKCAAQGDAVNALRISNRGQWLAYGGEGKRIDLCDAATGAGIQSFEGHDSTVRALAFSSDDRQLLSGDFSGTVKLWDLATGALIRTLSTGKEQRAINLLAFSPDGKRLFAGTDDNKVRIWDAATGKELKTLRMLIGPVTGMSVSSDGRRVAAGPYSQLLVKQWDTDTGKELQRLTTDLEGRFTTVNDVKYSPFGDGTLIATAKNQIDMWDVNSGARKLEIKYQDQEFVAISFTQDQRRLLSLDQGGVVRHWDKSTGALLLTVLSFGEAEWIQVTPEGFFDASPNGASYLSAVRGLDVYSINQFYQSLYRPDLVREKLAGDPRGLVRAAAANLDLGKAISSGNAPDVRVIVPGRALGTITVDGGTVSAEAGITDRGGGIGRVEWRVNGVTAGIDTPAATNQPLRLSRSLALDPGNNVIEVTAYNGANLIASLPGRLSVTSQVAASSITPPSPTGPVPSPAPAAAEKPRLFVLVAGINDYADKRIRLSYAVSDAREVARAFKEAAGSLYRSVEVKLMTDADVTREKLDAAFSEMAGKTSASDVFVLYLAGHGKTVDGRYYFIPQDLTIDGEFTDNAINASVKANAIAQEQWQRWFASVPARKSVILFDTCDSGTLTGDAGETQLLEKGAANDRLAEATGRSILTASGGSQDALEGYRGHGLFTLELLDGINNGDSDRNGTVDVSELAAYVYAQVTELSARVFGQRQAPQMKITTNYPLVHQIRILPDETTPVAAAKPAYHVAETARLQIKPGSGATVVRALSAITPVTVIESRDGWSLIAREGKPIGYVATKDLAPAQ